MTDLEKMVVAFRTFLGRHNIPLEGVSIELRFPTSYFARDAENHFKQDYKPFGVSEISMRDGSIKIAGIPVTFRDPKWA